jgi:hypothetical protein
MTTQRSVRRRLGWAWLIPIPLIAVVTLLLTSTTVGFCADAHPESGAESYCTSGPALGVPGFWLVLVVGVLAAGFFLFRFFRGTAR